MVLPIEEGSVSKKAEDDKDLKNRSMTNEFHFVPICLETMGVGGPKGYKFIKEVGKLISDKTMERRTNSLLRKSIRGTKEIIPAFWVQWKFKIIRRII